MTGSSIENHLAEQRFFAGLAPEFIAFLASCARERRFEADQILIRHDDPAVNFYLVRDGCISREVPAIQGPALVMESIGAGQILGWSWLIPPHRWSFFARADRRADVLEFDGTSVLARCEADPKFGYDLLLRFSALMSERLTHARQKIIDEWNAPVFG